MNASFLAACRNQPAAHTPVWFMRQAGRCLPEYRALRQKHGMLDIVRTPELATEVTLQPVRRLGVDAAILFSDIIVPLVGIGLDIALEAGTGPVVAQPFRSAGDLRRLRPLEPDADIPYVLETVRMLVKDLDVPLIGFAGGPFTLASYLIEGGPSKTHGRTKALMYGQPDVWSQLVISLADIAATALTAQVEAGAAAVQVFDSWVGNLSAPDYERYVLPASRRIFAGLPPDVPAIHFGVGTGHLLELMRAAGATVSGVDWRVPLDEARARLGDGTPVQGNLDPTRCLAPWRAVEEGVRDVLARNGGRLGHVFNLGWGVLPETDPDVLKQIVELVHGG